MLIPHSSHTFGTSSGWPEQKTCDTETLTHDPELTGWGSMQRGCPHTAWILAMLYHTVQVRSMSIKQFIIIPHFHGLCESWHFRSETKNSSVLCGTCSRWIKNKEFPLPNFPPWNFFHRQRWCVGLLRGSVFLTKHDGKTREVRNKGGTKSS